MPKTIESSPQNDAIPQNVMDAVNRTSANIDELKINLNQFLILAEPDVLAEMAPIQRAHALFLVAKATSMLFALRLKCEGVSSEDHPVKTELERLSLYEEKLERYRHMSREPVQRSTTLNYKAATRFIEHSLPDLTTDQRQSMRNISIGGAIRRTNSEPRNAIKKQKHQSVRAAAQEFLEKATKELLGNNNGDVKGPLRLDAFDAEDTKMDDSD